MSNTKDLTDGYQYLMQIRWKEGAIRIKQMRIDALRSCLLPKAITYDGDKVQTSPSDQMSDVMALIDELEREVVKMNREKSKLIIEISGKIAKLPNHTEQEILMGFYVAGYRMGRIAGMVGYSKSQAYLIRTRAVEHLMDLL